MDQKQLTFTYGGNTYTETDIQDLLTVGKVFDVTVLRQPDGAYVGVTENPAKYRTMGYKFICRYFVQGDAIVKNDFITGKTTRHKLNSTIEGGPISPDVPIEYIMRRKLTGLMPDYKPNARHAMGNVALLRQIEAQNHNENVHFDNTPKKITFKAKKRSISDRAAKWLLDE